MPAWPSAPRSLSQRLRSKRRPWLRPPHRRSATSSARRLPRSLRRSPRNLRSMRRSSPRPMATSRFARSRRSRRCSRITRRSPASPRSRWRPKPSSRRRPSVRRSVRPGCPSSRISRCRRKPKSGRPAARPRKSTRRSPSSRCCNASPMLASAAATKKPSRRSRPAPPVLPWGRYRRFPSASRSVRSPSKSANQDPVSEYAKRPAPQGLDAHGRPAPVAPTPQGDDHLDIPAFLRRQAN